MGSTCNILWKEKGRMKFLIVGDMHITGDRPVNRRDNYWEAVKRKTTFIFRKAVEHQVDAIISPGDVTDTPSISYFEFGEIIRIFKQELQGDIPFICTRGQHDLRYRTVQNIALKAFENALDNFFVLENTDSGAPVIYRKSDKYQITGCAYGQNIPNIREDGLSLYRILTIHKMIIDKKLWSAQSEYSSSIIFLRENAQFDLIVSGDNHQSFEAHTPGGRSLFNCGAMMRNKVDQVNHKPIIVLYDTDTKKGEKIYIPIEDAETVFRMEKVEVEKERNEQLEAFVNGISDGGKEVSLEFEDNLRSQIEKDGIDQEVAEIALNSLKKRNEA